MLVEANTKELRADYDPRSLTTITKNSVPLRTLARRVNGAFPGVVNPVAVWEVKEYYHTTTFGSRVAEGVYETLLDGMELEELREHEQVNIKHYLMIDAHYTWWSLAKIQVSNHRGMRGVFMKVTDFAKLRVQQRSTQ